MRILSATVTTNKDSADIVNLYTDLPSPIFPFDSRLCLSFKTAQNDGVDYVLEYFDLMATIIRND